MMFVYIISQICVLLYIYSQIYFKTLKKILAGVYVWAAVDAINLHVR